jgi:tRNA (mo5U34)-methyltransferase
VVRGSARSARCSGRGSSIDALALTGADERFDVVFCFGILHRVENPLGLLRRLGGLLEPGGRVLV